MKQIKRLLATSAMICLLAGCQLLPDNDNSETNPPIDVVQPPEGVIETPPVIAKKTEWDTILSPFVNKLLHSSSANEANKVILISDIQNRSGDYIATSQIDEVLHLLVSKENTFSVVDSKSVNQAKQALGISSDDKLVSRGKMIGLAKSINAGYVLFTTIYKMPSEDNDANISMELLSTQSGEILQRVTSKELTAPSQVSVDTAEGATE